jgi:hypothetical protein
MKYLAFILFVALVLSTNSRAEDAHTELMHITAHAGAGFVINTISYGVYSKGLGLNKTTSTILSIATALTANGVYKRIEGAGMGSAKSYLYTGIGAVGSAGTVAVFNW